MNKQLQAAQHHDAGYNCSQAVLIAFCKELGLSQEMAARVATGFGGGMRHGGTCGGVTGALMVLGLKYGQVEASDQETKMKAYKMVQEFQARFAKKHGSIVCKELLGHNIGTEEGMKCIKEQGLLQSQCNTFIADAITIVEEMIQEQELENNE